MTDTELISQSFPSYLKSLQLEIVDSLQSIESGATFKTDTWQRLDDGGHGISCILQNGKAGVNISVVHGPLPPAMESQMRARKLSNLGPGPFHMFATGLSLVCHPHNPNVPTVHANYRYFELRDANGLLLTPPSPTWIPFVSWFKSWIKPTKKQHSYNPDPMLPPNAWWFGGGCDLTPSYVFPDDATHFHNTIKEACDKHSTILYPTFKKWCDNYFYIPHRKEARGIGGIFFDDLDSLSNPPSHLASSANQLADPLQQQQPTDPTAVLNFVKDCANAFTNQYIPILQRRMNIPYTPAMKEWQQLRRGRYVEFNLVNDRGTKFGLATPGARIESVLMSLPLTARWEYGKVVVPGSREAEMQDVLATPREWV